MSRRKICGAGTRRKASSRTSRATKETAERRDRRSAVDLCERSDQGGANSTGSRSGECGSGWRWGCGVCSGRCAGCRRDAETPGTAQQTSAADVTPAISAPADVIVSEGDLSVNLTVTLTQAASPVAVTYSTHDSSATAFADTCTYDYIGKGGTLTFAAGEVSKTVKVDLIDCANAEPSSRSLRPERGNRRSHREDEHPREHRRQRQRRPQPTPVCPRRGRRRTGWDAQSPSSWEGRGRGLGQRRDVRLATSNGTATGSDYGGRNGQLTFVQGTQSRPSTSTIDDDAETEPAEQFTLTFSNPTGGATMQTERR